jgi:hypothetical protein
MRLPIWLCLFSPMILSLTIIFLVKLTEGKDTVDRLFQLIIVLSIWQHTFRVWNMSSCAEDLINRAFQQSREQNMQTTNLLSQLLLNSRYAIPTPAAVIVRSQSDSSVEMTGYP